MCPPSVNHVFQFNNQCFSCIGRVRVALKSKIKFFIFSDLQDIGIVSASEQKHLIEQARILHAAKSRPVGYSQRCEMSLERGTIIGV